MTKANETRKWVPPMLAGGLVMALGALPLQARPGQADPAQPASTTAPAGKLNSKDYNFLVQAARIDMDEVQLGELAQKQGASQAVRDFGQHMVNDHSKANSGLKEIAMQKGASLPAEPSQKQDATLQHLEGLSGPKFDQRYAEGMVKGHTHAVTEFERAAKDLSDTDLRAWAQTTLPLLQEHLRMAKNMEAAVQNGK